MPQDSVPTEAARRRRIRAAWAAGAAALACAVGIALIARVDAQRSGGNPATLPEQQVG